MRIVNGVLCLYGNRGVAGRVSLAGQFVRKSCMKSICFCTWMTIRLKCDNFMC